MKTILAIALAATLAGACDATTPGRTTGRRIYVVAAENVWGSIALALGGDRVAVTSVIDNPNADPHDFEPSAANARAIAGAEIAIENGIGYDAWMRKVLDANPSSGRITLDAGEITGTPDGGNPHQWYSPASVSRMIDAITAAYAKRDAPNASYFEQKKREFVATGLARYNALIGEIKARYTGTPVGASESLFEPMAAALGLRLLTPHSFLKAISQGAEPTAADKSAIDKQIATRAIKVYVYNSQNATPDVARQVRACKAKGIKIATITETPVPATAGFAEWQAAELASIEDALAAATGQ